MTDLNISAYEKQLIAAQEEWRANAERIKQLSPKGFNIPGKFDEINLLQNRQRVLEQTIENLEKLISGMQSKL